MPIFFLKGIKISRSQRLLLISSFASSIAITIVSIAHSITLFLPLSSASLLIIYIKVRDGALRLVHPTHLPLSSGGTCASHLQPSCYGDIRIPVFSHDRCGSWWDHHRIRTCSNHNYFPGQLAVSSISCSVPLPRSSIQYIPSSCT